MANYEVNVTCPHCGKEHPVCPGQLIGRIKSKTKAASSRRNGCKNKGKPRYTIHNMQDLPLFASINNGETCKP